jgi:hypothetical protein
MAERQAPAPGADAVLAGKSNQHGFELAQFKPEYAMSTHVTDIVGSVHLKLESIRIIELGRFL